MSHNRQVIRDAIVALLTNNTTCGANVYANREQALWATEVPAILVTSQKETAIPRDISGQTYIRDLTVEIHIKVSVNETSDDALDAIALEVEQIMGDDKSLSGTALGSTYLTTDLTFDASGQTDKGVAVMTYQIQYIQ
jgi:hypothetical protein